MRRPALRASGLPSAGARMVLRALAGVSAAVFFLALALAAAGFAYVLVRVSGRIADGDGAGAARWATISFVALGPLVVAYAAHAGRVRASAHLRAGTLPRLDLPALLLPAAVIAVAVAFQGLLGSGSWFVTDDWLHIARAHDATTGSGLTMGYLGEVVFIHYAPGHRFAYWLLDELSPLDWQATQVVMLALFAASLAVFHRICVRLFGQRRSNLVLLGLFGTSVLLVPSFLWLADAIHKFPSILLSLIAIHAYLAYRLDGRRWALAVCVAAVALGSLFYAKALLVPLYLVLIRVLFLERDPRAAARVIWAERRTWLAFAPVFAIYLVNYFVNYSDVGEGTTAPSLHLLGKYLWLAWFRGVTPAFVGVHVGIDAGSPELLMAFGAQALLIGVIVYTIRRKPSAWRAWVFWAVAFAANATVVALGRLGSLGLKQVGSQLRYDTEMTWLLPLALGFAFFPGELVARGDREPSDVRRRHLRHRRLRIAAVALALCAYLVATIDTGRDTAADWRHKASDQAKAWSTNLQRDAARIERSGRPVVAIDDQTPAFLIAPPHKPWNRLERLAPAVVPRIRVVPAAAHPLEIHQDGRLTPARVQGLAVGRHAISDSGSVSLRGGRRWQRGRMPCVRTGSEPGAIVFGTQADFAGESLFATVDYEVLRRSSRPAVVTGDTYRGAHGTLPLDRRRGRAVFNLGHRLTALLPAGTSVCLRTSAVGWIDP